MAQIDDLEALAKRHGALSYRNRADTQTPAFGFSAAGLESLLAEVRKQDEPLIRQLLEALETCNDSGYYPYSYDDELVEAAAAAARARLAPPPPTA